MTAAPRLVRAHDAPPPYSEDAEQAVLSAMLTDAGAIVAASGIVDDSMFFADRHRRIFRTIVALHQRGTAVDPITLSEELARGGDLEPAGGKDYIGYLIDCAPTTTNVEYHAAIVRDHAQRRASRNGSVAPPASDEPPLADAGNSTRLVNLHGHRLRFIPPWGRWLVETAGFWALDHRDVGVRELAKDVGRQLKTEAAAEPDHKTAARLFAFALRSLNAPAIAAMVDLARGIEGVPLDHEQLDANGWLLGVQNGVIDLRSGRLRPAKPSDLITMQCPTPWDEEARAPRWSQAMEQWFPDAAVRGYVQRVAGSALVGAQRDHIFVIHFGGGRNGKGTFTRAQLRVLGPYACVIHLSLLVEVRHKDHDTVKAALFRKRLAIASETQRRMRLDEASVKNLTGGDRITARRMREDPWSFDPTHSLWLQTNHLPQIGGRDRGIWSRIRVVKWQTTFDDREQDRDLDSKLANEAAGILAWLVQGCLQWQRDGLAEPAAVVGDTLAYRQAEDVFARFAADTGLVFRPDAEIPAAELQELLSEWVHAEGVDPPRQEFAAWLKEHDAKQRQRRVAGTDPGKGKRPRFWQGVGLDA